MKKRIALFLAIAMIVTLLAGCGGGTSSTPSSAPASGEGSGSSAQPVGTDKLVIWSYMNEGEPISTWEQSIVDAYSAEYPDVEVEIVFCGREIDLCIHQRAHTRGLFLRQARLYRGGTGGGHPGHERGHLPCLIARRVLYCL